MKMTIDQIEIFAELLEENDNLLLSLQLMEAIYNLSFREIIERLNRGEKVEVIASQLLNSRLFEELVLFYTNSEPLSDSLKDTIRIIKRLDSFKRNLVNMMIYPMILILSLFVFSIFALLYLKPQFMSFYESFNISISFWNGLLLNGLFMIPFIIIVVIAVIIAILLELMYILKKNDYSGMMKRIRLPVLSKVIQVYLSLKFALYYGEFLEQGASVFEMVEFLKNRIQDPLISMIALEIEVELVKGIQLETVIERMPYFDRYLKLTMKLSQSYENEKYLFDQYFENTMNKIGYKIKLLQSFITVITYSLVGLYIVGIYSLMVLPMTNMISQL